MPVPIVCTGEITFVNETTVTCAGSWTAYESDILQFASLLEFNGDMFVTLLGACAVAFITGHTAGHVARNLTRV